MRVVAIGCRGTADEHLCVVRGRAAAQTMQTSASACARRMRGAARTPRAWRQWLCDARAVRAARVHGRCVTGKDIALIAEQTLQHASSSATNSARIILVAVLALLVSYSTIRRTSTEATRGADFSQLRK